MHEQYKPATTYINTTLPKATLTYYIYLFLIGLKWIVILVIEYSFSFQRNSPNILLNITSSKITVFSGEMMSLSVD